MAAIRIGDEQVHYTWSARHAPVTAVTDGAVLEIATRDGFDGQFASLDVGDLQADWGPLDFSRIAPLTGPIAVDGVRTGDVLRVEILEVRPAGPGNTVVWPSWAQFDFFRPAGVGPAGRVFSFDADALSGTSVELQGVTVPLDPMVGMVGVAPAQGEFPTLPPRHFGGNIDCRLLRAGSAVLLRAQVDGGCVSFGDGHAAQGDGELCTTAIECPLTIRVRLSKDRRAHLVVEEPRIEVGKTAIFTASAESIEQATRQAVSYAHAYLMQERGLDADTAYAALSLIGNLRVNQVVNKPRVGVRVELREEGH